MRDELSHKKRDRHEADRQKHEPASKDWVIRKEGTILRFLIPVYTIQPVVKSVVQPV